MTLASKVTEYFVRHTSGAGSTYGPIDSERDARLVVDLLDQFTSTLAQKPIWQAYKRTTVIEETIL